MANSRTNEWKGSPVYSERQIQSILSGLGIDVRDETDNDFLSFCPYHGNRDTPAFSTSKRRGVSICFNPACDTGGHVTIRGGRYVEQQGVTLDQLIKDIKGTNYFETKRFIKQYETADDDFESRLREAMEEEPEFVRFDKADMFEVWEREFWASQRAQDYMMSYRGFEEETLRKFQVGYSPAMDMIDVPMYDPTGNIPIGLIGRACDPDNKAFKNSPKLPKSKTIWNLHRARRYETIILTEASFDAMRVDQAGYPNVGALLGGSLSPHHKTWLRRYFSKVIIMTDNDQPQYYVNCAKCKRAGNKMCLGHRPGRELGNKIVNELPSLEVLWAVYSDTEVYARNVKDASDMTDDEIRKCLRGAISNFEYQQWQA